MKKYVYVVMIMSTNGNKTPLRVAETYEEAMNFINSKAHEETYYNEEIGMDQTVYVDNNGFEWYVEMVEWGC